MNDAGVSESRSSDTLMIVNKKLFITHRKAKPSTGGKPTVFIFISYLDSFFHA